MSTCQPVVMSTCHHVGTFCQILQNFGNYYRVTMPPCHHVILLYCYLAILSSCQLVNLSSYHPVIFSVWQLFNLSDCEFVSLWACKLFSLSALQLAHLGVDTSTACFCRRWLYGSNIFVLWKNIFPIMGGKYDNVFTPPARSTCQVRQACPRLYSTIIIGKIFSTEHIT